LVTGADGAKLGKTAKGTIWLDPERTSPYRYYQFWLNQEDADVIDLLKYFTWLDQEAVADLEKKLQAHPERREAQRTLAQEMTRITHGETALQKAELASQVLFGGDLEGLSADDIADIFADVPSSDVPKHDLEGEGASLVAVMDDVDLSRSRGAARRLLKSGGVYVNNQRVQASDRTLTLDDAIEGRFIVLRRGKKTYHLVRVIE
jgi:tyrosyl-tRNA synthetase